MRNAQSGYLPHKVKFRTIPHYFCTLKNKLTPMKMALYQRLPHFIMWYRYPSTQNIMRNNSKSNEFANNHTYSAYWTHWTHGFHIPINKTGRYAPTPRPDNNLINNDKKPPNCGFQTASATPFSAKHTFKPL